MGDYRAYFLGKDGHIVDRVDLVCLDDEEAKAHAQQLVDGHDVELWQLHRKIEKFTTNDQVIKRWTADEDQRLLELKQERKPIAVIAKELERTESAVIDRLGHLRRDLP